MQPLLSVLAALLFLSIAAAFSPLAVSPTRLSLTRGPTGGAAAPRQRSLLACRAEKKGLLGGFGAFLEDVADYLDEKGGYIITEEMLKGPASGPSSGGAEEPESRLDLEMIERSFATPKKKAPAGSVNIMIGLMLSTLLWGLLWCYQTGTMGMPTK
mmetsp:Transcript_59730/g.136513  ORF Transcript_59730/g.136513 Transcript_59730/m.136513 type:complete len:156 (+) Transcript_59730:295-762(+)